MNKSFSTTKTIFTFVFLLIVFIVFSLVTNALLLNYEIPFLGSVSDLWSNSADLTGATLGVAIAVSGAFVAIVIAQRTADLAERSDRREVFNFTYQTLTNDIQRIKVFRNYIEKLTFKSQIAVDLIERSELLKLSTNSVECSVTDLKDVSCKGEVNAAFEGQNVTSLEKYFYNSKEGQIVKAQLRAVIAEFSDDMLSLSNSIDDLISSNEIIELWAENFKKLLNNEIIMLEENKGNYLNNSFVSELYNFFSGVSNGKVKGVDDLNSMDLLVFLQKLSSTFRNNALCLKFGITEENLDINTIFFPLIEMAAKVYTYKLSHYHEFASCKNAEKSLEVLNMLPLTFFVSSTFNYSKHQGVNNGLTSLALLYVISSINENACSPQDYIDKYFIDRNELTIANKKQISSRVMDSLPDSDGHVGCLLNYLISDYIYRLDTDLFRLDMAYNSVDQQILQRQFETFNPNYRKEIIAFAEDFFESYPVKITELDITGALISGSDCLEPLFIYWINRDRDEFTGLVKNENSLLYFIYKNPDRTKIESKYEYKKGDKEKLEGLFKVIHHKYFQNDKLELTELVSSFRNKIDMEDEDTEVSIKTISGVI